MLYGLSCVICSNPHNTDQCPLKQFFVGKAVFTSYWSPSWLLLSLALSLHTFCPQKNERRGWMDEWRPEDKKGPDSVLLLLFSSVERRVFFETLKIQSKRVFAAVSVFGDQKRRSFFSFSHWIISGWIKGPLLLTIPPFDGSTAAYRTWYIRMIFG